MARPTPWGNPFTADGYLIDYPDAPVAARRRMAVSDFRGAMEGKWDFPDEATYPSREEIRSALRGHDLACWCPLGQPCHADVLIELANS